MELNSNKKLDELFKYYRKSFYMLLLLNKINVISI